MSGSQPQYSVTSEEYPCPYGSIRQKDLDDLMISRPGGIVRMKSPGALVPIVTPPLSSDSYKMMDYLDQVRAGRSGVG